MRVVSFDGLDFDNVQSCAEHEADKMWEMFKSRSYSSTDSYCFALIRVFDDTHLNIINTIPMIVHSKTNAYQIACNYAELLLGSPSRVYKVDNSGKIISGNMTMNHDVSDLHFRGDFLEYIVPALGNGTAVIIESGDVKWMFPYTSYNGMEVVQGVYRINDCRKDDMYDYSDTYDCIGKECSCGGECQCNEEHKCSGECRHKSGNKTMSTNEMFLEEQARIAQRFIRAISNIQE